MIPAKKDDTKEFKRLFSTGAEVNAQDRSGNTALHYAASNGNRDIVQLLLSHSDIDLNLENQDRYTALQVVKQRLQEKLLKHQEDMYYSGHNLLSALENINTQLKSAQKAREQMRSSQRTFSFLATEENLFLNRNFHHHNYSKIHKITNCSN